MPYITLSWLADHVELPKDLTIDQVAQDLVRVGLEDEGISGAGITGPVVVGRVVSMVPEEQKNGRVINWCHVDVGPHNAPGDGGTPSSPRGIVCGAHNFAEGDLVVAALDGAVLPGPFPISARRTYGHVSDGMICSAAELGLGTDHEGIIVLERFGYTPEAGYNLTPGVDALEMLGLAEQTLEVNVTPDRGYCFSMRGLAREFSHATGAEFTDHGLPGPDLPSPTTDGFGVEVVDDAPIHGVPGCDRFVTRIVRGIDPGAPSPAWLRRKLTQAGMRPISLTVDVTNFVMLDLGQPLHAYDLDVLAAPIIVRRANPGENLTTLDEVTRPLADQDLLITDSQGGPGARILGIAGVMGGALGEVGPGTTDVLIESAHFDQITVARSARRHRIPSEAAKRFERGVDPSLAPVAAQRVVDLLIELGGGVADDAVSDLDTRAAPQPIRFALGEPERLVGIEYPPEQVRATLTRIGCRVQDVPGEDSLDVTAPSWRSDLTGPHDLVEEVARLVGYDKIPSILPVAPAGRGLTKPQLLRRSVARGLAEAGMAETLSYPFVSAAQFDQLRLTAGDSRRRASRLVNPLSEAAPFMRTGLLLTLLQTARRNVARGMIDVALFEIGLVTQPVPDAPMAPQLPLAVRPSDEELAALDAAVPPQPRQVAGVLAGHRVLDGWWGSGRGAEWSDAVEMVRLVARTAGVELEVSADAERAPWHPGRCAQFTLADGTILGHAGELHPKVLEELDLPARTVAFEVDLDTIIGAAPAEPLVAEPVSGFPAAKEDLAFVVDAGVTAQELRAVLVEAAGDLCEDVRLFDVYTGPQVGEGRKSLAFALRLRAHNRTLSTEQVLAVRERAVQMAGERFGATLRA